MAKRKKKPNPWRRKGPWTKEQTYRIPFALPYDSELTPKQRHARRQEEALKHKTLLESWCVYRSVDYRLNTPHIDNGARFVFKA